MEDNVLATLPYVMCEKVASDLVSDCAFRRMLWLPLPLMLYLLCCIVITYVP